MVPTLCSSGFGSQSPENTRLWLFTGQRTSAVSWSFFSGTGGSCCLSPFGQLYKITADWVTYKQRNLFLILLEAGSPRSEGQHGWVLVEALFQVADCPPLAVSSRAGRGRGVLWESLFINKRVLIPLMRALPSQPHLPKAPPPNTIPVGIRVST